MNTEYRPMTWLEQGFVIVDALLGLGFLIMVLT